MRLVEISEMWLSSRLCGFAFIHTIATMTVDYQLLVFPDAGGEDGVVATIGLNGAPVDVMGNWLMPAEGCMVEGGAAPPSCMVGATRDGQRMDDGIVVRRCSRCWTAVTISRRDVTSEMSMSYGVDAVKLALIAGGVAVGVAVGVNGATGPPGSCAYGCSTGNFGDV